MTTSGLVDWLIIRLEHATDPIEIEILGRFLALIEADLEAEYRHDDR